MPRGRLLGLPTLRPSTVEARQDLDKLRRARNPKNKEGNPREEGEGQQEMKERE